MTRPRMFHVVLDYERAPNVYEGKRAMLKHTGLYTAHRSFRSRQSAEEWAAWWQYEHPPWWERDKKEGGR